MSPDQKRKIQDNYEILEDIGRGGMAHVYKARQLSLDRVVAIKEIKPAIASSPELVERFKREARTAAGLIHENIVQVYNFGEPRTDTLFIVMEYIEGMDLRSLLYSGGAVPPRVAAIVIREVARALSFAHARGLVHRDVKPGNVMISSRGEVKLMDFGIVREMDSDLTRTGVFLGTPNYMAPEQFLGEEITPAADLFSIGVVLYEILTGQKPFKADSEGSLARKIRTEKEAKVRSFNPSVPRRLQGIVHACLRKNPGARPHDAEDLIHRLDRYLGPARREDQRREVELWVGDVSVADRTVDIDSSEKAREQKVKIASPRPARKPIKIKEAATPKERKKDTDLKQTRVSERSSKDVKKKKSSSASTFEQEPLADETGETPELGDLIARWLWRLILLAIALLAAVIAFQFFDPDKVPGGGAIKNFFEKVLPDDKEEPPKEP